MTLTTADDDDGWDAPSETDLQVLKAIDGCREAGISDVEIARILKEGTDRFIRKVFE